MTSRSRTLAAGFACLALLVAHAEQGTHAQSQAAARSDTQRTSAARPDTATPAERPQTTLADQVDLSLTVYNADLALVRDVRQLSLPSGISSLRFADVAASVNPATVHLRSLTEPSALVVLEQDYQYDLLEPDKLLRKYVGRDVTLVRDRQENGSTRSEEITARLLAYNNGPVWKIGNEIVTGLRVDGYRFPELPDNLFSHPTLVWQLQNGGAARHRVEASYLARGLAWNADYVLTVARDDKSADLAGWVTVKNESGTSYPNTNLQLVAGDLHMTPQKAFAEKAAVGRAMDLAAAAPPAFAQENFSEYHLYSLQRRTTLNDRQTKQISLLSAPSLAVEKRFVVNGQQFYYRNQQRPGEPLKDVVRVYYRFRNDEKSGLGMPMPAGVVRVYQADSKGGVQFAGEDRIGHTPKDERIDLYTGNAFDVVCERKQTDYKRVNNTTVELAYEITLRNHKSTAITVEVNEPIGGDWQMLESSHKWAQTDAWAARFSVPVAADGTSVLTYRVRARW